MDEKLRIIISGGGTGGHIFPAVSIANAIRRKHNDADILFVGALGRMEMQRVPAAGACLSVVSTVRYGSQETLVWLLITCAANGWLRNCYGSSVHRLL